MGKAMQPVVIEFGQVFIPPKGLGELMISIGHLLPQVIIDLIFMQVGDLVKTGKISCSG